ncbi:MAG: cell division protein FtsL [Candidatus Aminicenantes bacterium]|nr:cell division protein FtsL [Candidatus Aminicenantes bacterium]
MVRKRHDKREIILGAACLLLAIAFLTFYIWHQAALISLGYQTSRLEEKISRLEEEIKGLEIKKTALLSLEKVETIARDKLGLAETKSDQILYQDFRVIDDD